MQKKYNQKHYTVNCAIIFNLSCVVRLYADLSKSINMHLFVDQIRAYTVFLKHWTTYISLASLVLAVFLLGCLRIFTELVGLNITRNWKWPQLMIFCHWKRLRLHLSNSSGRQSKVKLFSWNCQDLRYSRLLERHLIIKPALMKRLDLGHDPEPIVVNGSLFPLTSAGFGSGLYFLKWIDSQRKSAISKWHPFLRSWKIPKTIVYFTHGYSYMYGSLLMGSTQCILKVKKKPLKSKRCSSHSEYLI